jgi:hypothetical protein
MDSRAPRRRRVALTAFIVVAVLNAVMTLMIFSYILLRGTERDAENARMQQQIRDSWCTALDELPAGGPLDRLRATYHCGPGLPPTKETP